MVSSILRVMRSFEWGEAVPRVPSLEVLCANVGRLLQGSIHFHKLGMSLLNCLFAKPVFTLHLPHVMSWRIWSIHDDGCQVVDTDWHGEVNLLLSMQWMGDDSLCVKHMHNSSWVADAAVDCGIGLRTQEMWSIRPPWNAWMPHIVDLDLLLSAWALLAKTT